MSVTSPRARLRSTVAVAAAAASLAAIALAPQAVADTGDGVTRYGGSDRYDTAARTALQSHSDGSRPDTVFIASGADYPDALAAGAAAQGTFGDPSPSADHFGGALLLTQPTSLPGQTKSALDQLDPRRIVVVGGSGAVSDGVLRSLKSYAGTVERWEGDDRYATAAEISRKTRLTDASHVRPDHVFIASGQDFPDAVTAGAVAGQLDAPMMLVRQDHVAPATLAEIKAVDPSTIVIAGGSAIVSDGVKNQLAKQTGATVVRAAGSDRYATSVELAEYLEGAHGIVQHGAAIATGTDYADALTASNLWEPVLLVRPGAVPASVATFLEGRDITWIDIVGGTGVVHSSVENSLQAYLGGPATVNSGSRREA